MVRSGLFGVKMKHDRNGTFLITLKNWEKWYDLNPFRFPKMKKHHKREYNVKKSVDPSPRYDGNNEYYPEDYGRPVQ